MEAVLLFGGIKKSPCSVNERRIGQSSKTLITRTYSSSESGEF